MGRPRYLHPSLEVFLEDPKRRQYVVNFFCLGEEGMQSIFHDFCVMVFVSSFSYIVSFSFSCSFCVTKSAQFLLAQSLVIQFYVKWNEFCTRWKNNIILVCVVVLNVVS